MLREGAIFHDARAFTFWNWQFDNEVLNIVVLGILTTVFSYQLTAICYNVLLGIKERGRATACDIHKLLLIKSATPLEVFGDLVRLDIFDRIRLKGTHPRNMKITRRGTRVGTKTILSVMLLVTVGPVFSIASILMVLPRDEKFSFRDTDFGGVALGVGVDNVTYQSLDPSCDRILLRIVGRATAQVRFSLCYDFEISFDQNLVGNEIMLSAETTFHGQMKVSLVSFPSKIPLSFALNVDMSAEKQLFRVQPVLQLREAAQLIHDGQTRLGEYCDLEEQPNSPQAEGFLDIEDSGGVLKASKVFKCNHSATNLKEFVDTLHHMARRISLIESDSMNVVNVNNVPTEANSLPEYFDAGWITFFVLRSRNVSLLPLLVVTFLSLSIRILTDLVLNNDLEEGLDAIVRDTLGVESEELLGDSRIVSYNCNCQDSLTPSYGISIRKSQAVK